MSRAAPRRRHSGACMLMVRQQLGLTQRAMAERLGLQQPNLAAIESGARGVKLETLARWAEELGCELVLEMRVRGPGS